MYSRSEIKAGIVILVSFTIAAIVIIAAGKFGDFFATKQNVQIYFTDIQGLKPDDPVQIMGFERGKVGSIKITKYQDESGQLVPVIEVSAKVAYPEAFAKDTKVTIDRSLTGTTLIKIEPGRSPEKFAPGEKIVGVGSVSMTEVASKLGVMTKRLDDFVTDITDKNISGALRAALMSLKGIMQNATLVVESLSHSVPGSEKNLVDSIKNIKEASSSLNQMITGNRELFSTTLQNVSKSSESLVRLTTNTDQLIAQNSKKVQDTLEHIEKSASNVRVLSREVRWQPWLLLNKPDEQEIRERHSYNAALEFTEGAESLNEAVRELVGLEASKDKSPERLNRIKKLLEQIESNLQKSVELERKIWNDLVDRAKPKSK